MELHELGWNSFFEEHFAPYQEKGFIPARIALEERNLYTAYSEWGELSGRVSGKFRHNARSRSDFPAVGDWVAVSGSPETGKMVIHGVLPRKSTFSRKVASNLERVTDEQVISANIDAIFLVIALDADFNIRRLERYLTIARESGASLFLVLNKADLCSDIEERLKEVKSITSGIPIYVVSALKNEGLEQLRIHLSSGKTIVLVGSSGVGKSTLINSLLGEERQKVGAVRGKDGKGRHITVKRELVIMPGGAILIDNPGIRTISLWDEEGLDGTFGDIVALMGQCKFRDCQHRTEPGCAIRKAIEEGSLDKDRYNNYLRLQRELKILAMRKEQRARTRGLGG